MLPSVMLVKKVCSGGDGGGGGGGGENVTAPTLVTGPLLTEIGSILNLKRYFNARFIDDPICVSMVGGKGSYRQISVSDKRIVDVRYCQQLNNNK